MDRRCAGALLALAACIASTAAAPTASNQTALDLYDGEQQGCYYNFQHYGEGDRIMTNEPCLNCTCHNRMLMCYLRVCPFTKPIGQDCSVEKRADQCCPIITCPDVPVDLLTSTSTTSPAEYGETGLGKLDRYGCSINGKYFPEGAKVPPTPSKPCEHCYCIRNMTTCVMQECTLHVDGCTPIYHKDVCCPVRYSCDHPEDEIPLLDDMTTTVRPTPGFLLTTTTLSPVTQMTQDCIHDDKVFADGALIKTEKACEHCYCMKGDIVCVVQECGTPMENEGKNCTSMPPREGQCCPDTYICEGDELTTETKPDFTTDSTFDEITTLSPPRRVIVEGSGYRKEPGEPFTEEPTFEPDNEGSGDDKPFKPIDEGEETIPETETTQPLITTESDDRIGEESPSTSRIPVVDTEMIDKVTTEPDKGENTVPSGGVNEDVPQISISDKTTPEESKLATEPGLTTESYFYTKTTAVHEDDSSITDTITTEAEVAPTKTDTGSQTTIADYQSPILPDDKTTTEPTKVTETTPNKQEEDKTPSEITTFKDKKDELTTKATDFVGADEQTTESIQPLVDQEVETTTSQQLLEQENEVLVNVPTTESSTKLDITKTETDTAVTIATEVPTPGKEHMVETTSVNPVDNEIDEESYPTSSPGRIPGEGDCLLDGITYSNESIVPSSSNCHTSCRCISSIVKCDPIICSAPPDYMDNCQPMYDPPESCCPTYVCDHTRETVPPQSHSQMAGTESPVPTPSVECDGDQCEIIKDKKDSTEPTDSSKKPVDCGAEGCEETDEKPDHESHPSTEECVDEKCIPQAHCADGKCESPVTPDQICDNENGCKVADDQACQGEDCKTQSVSPAKDSSTPCDSAGGCKDDQAPPSQAQCADGKCESSPTTNQICDTESGCQIPVKQACEGEDCKGQPEIIPEKDSSAPCNNVDDCKEEQLPERVPDCEGESCTSRSGPKETDDCKDGSDCAQPNQSPALEECKEEGCRRKDVPDISKPATSECTDSNCVSQDNSQPITDAPEYITEAVPKTTDLSESDETISDKPVTDLPKTPDVEKEVEPKITTEASIFVKDEETTHYDVTDREKEAESMPSITDIPEIKTQAPEIQQYTTEVTMQKETTVDQLEVTPAPLDESSTDVPKLSDNETDRLPDLPGVVESESPKPETKPTEQPLVDEHQTEVTREDITSDLQKHDFTTEMPSIQDMATEISEDTTTYTHKDSPDITTKIPEYVQEQDEIQTESSTTVSSLDEVKDPDNVNEPPESDTSASEETSTKKLDEQPIEHETQDTVTTPRSYGGETNAPEMLETETPTRDVLEEQHDTHTDTPDKLSSLSPEQQAQTEKSEQPDSIATSDEPITNKPDDMVSVTEEMLTPDNESETKSPVLPEVSPSEGTPISVSTTIPEEDLYTETPSHDTSDEIAVTPFETPDKNKVSTEVPMSIIRDKTEEVEEKPTQASEINEPISQEESTTLGTESSAVSPTESSGTEVEQTEPVKEETVKNDEKESSPGDEEHLEAMTEKSDTELKATVLPVLDDEVSSEQPEIPVIVASTEKIPETGTIIEQPEDLEPSVTEAGVTEPTASGQQTSEIEPVTSVPTESIDTKAPELFTEAPTHAVPEDNEIEKEDLSTGIPELTIHEHTEPTFTTENSEQFDAGYTGPPNMSATEPQDISTQKETEKIPDLQENITNAPEVSATESQKEATEALGPEKVTPGQEPNEYEIKDVTTAVPDTPATELHEATGAPEVQDIVTVIPETPTVNPEKIATESQEAVTEPAIKATEAPQIQDITTNIPDTYVKETHKDDSGLPDSQTTIIPDVLEKEHHKESTEVPDSLDIITNAPDVSESDSDKEASESPSSQDTTSKVPELSETAVTEAQKEASEEPETQEVVTVALETNMQKDVTKIPENQDIATSAPKISVTEAQEEASEAPETQDVSTKIPEILTTETQKDETEISDDLPTNIPEIPVTESQKETTEVTEASMGPDIVTEIPESPATKSEAEVTTVSVSQVGTTNIPETDLSETNKDITESPVAQDVATEISETSATESQKAVTDAPVAQDTTASIPDIIATDTQKEVTEASVTQDHETNIAETHVTDSPKEAIETPMTSDVATDIPEPSVTDSQKDTTEVPVAQDKATKIPESLATEPQKEVTEAPMVQDIATNIPEIPATESHQEATETPVAQDVATNIPEIPATESQKEATEAPVTQDAATNIPETSTTESQKEVTETSVDQDSPSNIPETPSTETKKDMTQAPVVEDVATVIPEITATESQKIATESPETQEFATNTPEITVTEAEEKVTEVPMAQDVANIIPGTPATESEKEITEAPVAQDVATSVPETSATDSDKEVTETPVAQDIATSVPEISATESEKEITETPVAMDVATSGPEISATEPQKEATESPISQNVATSVPKTPATEFEKEVTETPVTQDVATSVTETFATESEKEKTETPVTMDVATSVPEISATESQKEATETPVPGDAASSAPETFTSESQKEVTESPINRDVATSIPEVSATEPQQEMTEAPVTQDVATSAADTSVTELQKEVTETPVTKDIEASVPETFVTESQKKVTEAPVTQDITTSVPEIVSTESQQEVTEAPASQDVVENEITVTPVPHVIVTNIPEIAGTEAPKYDISLSPEGELLHEQSTKVPESLVTETQDINIATDKPTPSLQDSDDNKPKDDEHTEMPLVEPSKPEKSDASTESPITSDSVEPDIKSPQPSDSDSDIVKATKAPTTEYQPIEEEVNAFSKTPDRTESPDQTIKISEEPEQTSEYPETTPYLVILEEHTHKKDIYTTSPEEEITTGASDLPSDYEPTTQAYLDKVSEAILTTEAGLPPKQEVVPTEKDESAYVTEEVTKSSLISEEITTISPSRVTVEVQSTEKPQDLETNEISTAAPGEDQKETDKPPTGVQDETDKLVPSATEKPHETTSPEEEFILATTKATTIREEDLATPSLVDKYGKPDEVPQPASEPETQKPDVTDELPKPGVSEVQTTEEAPQPDSDNQFPPSGTSGYGQEPDYGEEDQAFGPGTCRYGGKVYVSAQQIPRDDPCDFCFCFRSDIICLQQSCPPPIHGCHEEPIQGFCCPRYECPVSMATTLNVTTTTTTTTTTLPPHFLPHAYKGAAQRRGCQIKGHTYKVGEVVRASSGPCLHCTCGGDGQMKCDPKVCTPEPMLRQMIAAAVSAKRRR